MWTDFKPQIKHLDTDKLTIIAWDPPGHGKSRPPNKEYSLDFFHNDAICGHNLMKILGYDKYSLIGYSGGGISSLLIASAYPESIRKMVVSGTIADIYPEEMKKLHGVILHVIWNIYKQNVQSYLDIKT